MKLLDFNYGEEISGYFKVSRGQAQDEWRDQNIELSFLDNNQIGVLLPPIEGEQEKLIGIRAESAKVRNLLSNLPSSVSTLGYVLNTYGSRVELLCRYFRTPPTNIPVPLEVLITDEFIDTYLIKQTRRVKDFKSAIDWLKYQFLMDGFGYWFVTSGVSELSEKGGFSIVGTKYRLDLSRKSNGELSPNRILRHNKQSLDFELIYLIKEKIEFVDKTLAKIHQYAIISSLNKALKTDTSWISSWRRYNEQERLIVEERFSLVPELYYDSWIFSRFDNTITFNLIGETNLSQWNKRISEGSFPTEISASSIDSQGRQVLNLQGGIAISCDLQQNRLILDWDAHEDPPKKGSIRPSSIPEQAKLRSRDTALQKLANQQVQLPTLGLILEGQTLPSVQKHRNRNVTQKAKKMFGGKPTPAQEKALRVAITTPDIALIQGPPGTGKTRVIQALLTILSEGQRSEEAFESILVTSFQHEAVDNAIAGMKVSGLPVDRVGGKKGEDRGQELFDSWSKQVIQGIRQKIPETKSPRRVLVEQLEGLISHWRTSPAGLSGARNILLQFRELTGYLLTSERALELDRLIDKSTPKILTSSAVIVDEDDRERLEKLLSQQCLTEDEFIENGPRRARRLLTFISQYTDELSADILEAVDVASQWEPAVSNNREIWVSLGAACEGIKSRLLEIPLAVVPEEQDVIDQEVELCLLTTLAEIKNAELPAQEMVYEALELFIRSLEEEKNQVRDSIRKYAAIQAVSCGQADSQKLGMRDQTTFSLIIVDEAARANPLDLLIPMVKGRRIILVGDHKQLPHVLEREIEESLSSDNSTKLKEIYQKSLFERLWESLSKQSESDGIERTVQLVDQFRMHPVIGNFVSQNFYRDSPLNSSFVQPSDRQNETDLYEEKPVAWLNVPSAQGKEEIAGNRSWRRYAEVTRIIDELRKVLPKLVEKYPEADPNQPQGMVGVIAFYSAQEEAINDALDDAQTGLPSHLRKRVRVGTVDAFQGREYDVVYLSTVRSNQNKEVKQRLGFTALPNRLCVAFSRARCVLVGVGDSACVAGLQDNNIPWSTPLNNFVELCKGKEGYVEY